MSDNNWWALSLLQKIVEEVTATKAFEEYAKDCPHLELENDGKAICHHPARDNPSDWVMCNRKACPFMMVNASPEEMKEYSTRLALDSINAWCGEKLDKEVRDD